MGELMKKGVSKELPRLGDFRMVSQYSTGVVGLITAAMGGRNLVKKGAKRMVKGS